MMYLMTFLISLFFFQDGSGTPSIEQLLSMLAPLVVYGATWVVTRIKVNIPSWAILAVVVPVLSIAATYILSLIGTGEGSDMSWLQQFIYNLAAVFVNEIIKKTKEAVPTTPNP